MSNVKIDEITVNLDPSEPLHTFILKSIFYCINVLGYFESNVNFNDKNVNFFKSFVIENGGQNLLVRDLIKMFNIKLSSVNVLDTVEPSLE